MLADPSRRTLFLGHFGSGKTEVAVHFALRLAAGGEHPLLLDLDFITPYFRSRDLTLHLARAGVTVVAPEGELRASDLPVITGRAVHALSTSAGPVVVDAGGDEGARVLGSLSGYLKPDTYRALLVVNPYRPGTGSPEEIARHGRWLEELGRVKLTGVVNNSNLMGATTVAVVRQGLAVVAGAGQLLHLPVAFTAVRSDLAREFAGLTILPLSPLLRPPWEAPPVSVQGGESGGTPHGAD